MEAKDVPRREEGPLNEKYLFTLIVIYIFILTQYNESVVIFIIYISILWNPGTFEIAFYNF